MSSVSFNSDEDNQVTVHTKTITYFIICQRYWKWYSIDNCVKLLIQLNVKIFGCLCNNRGLTAIGNNGKTLTDQTMDKPMHKVGIGI